MAEQLGTQTNVRVLHAGGGGKRSASQLALSAPDDFPTLSHSTSTPDLQVIDRMCRVLLPCMTQKQAPATALCMKGLQATVKPGVVVAMADNA